MISLITVGYRKPQWMEEYISAVHHHHPGTEVIIVDVEPSRTPNVPSTHYIPLVKANYSEAVNTGLRVATGEYLVWGNEDIIVSGPFLEHMISFIEEIPERLVGIGRGKQCGHPFIVGWLVAMHRNALKHIGYLDERFPGTFEDVDYSIRAVNAGYELLTCRPPVAHRSTGRLNAHLFTGRDLLLEKWGRG